MNQNFSTRSSRRISTATNPGTVSTRGSAATATDYLTPLPRFSTEPTVRCLSFGPDRVERWGKGYNFCGKCQYAQEMMEKHKAKKWPNLDGKRYKCEAKHQSLSAPQTVGQWQPSRSLSHKRHKKRSISEKSSSPPPPSEVPQEQIAVEAEEDAPMLPPVVEPPTVTPANANLLHHDLQKKIESLEKQLKRSDAYIEHLVHSQNSLKNDILLLETELSDAREKNTRMHNENKTMQYSSEISTQDVRLLKEEVSFLKTQNKQLTRSLKRIEHIEEKRTETSRRKRAEKKTKMRNMSIYEFFPYIIEKKLKKYKSRFAGPKVGEALAKCVWDTQFQGGCCIPHLRKHANRDLRVNFFTPWACAKASDMSGGKINGTTFTVLREVYTKGVRTPDCPLPSASTVQRAKRALNRYAFHHGIAKWRSFQSSTGEGVRFTNIHKFVNGLFTAYGMDKVATRKRVDMVVAHDGFLLTNVLSANMLGIKMNQYEAICPRTKTPLFIGGDENHSVNSSEHCYPLVIVMGKESESLVRENFQQPIELLAEASTDFSWTKFQNKYGYKPFRLCMTPDFSARWKGLCKGGACKISAEFCDACECNSVNVHKPRVNKCEEFCADDIDENHKCYHYPMATEEMVNGLKLKLEELLSIWNFDHVEKESKIKFFEIGDENRTLNENSVYYVPTTAEDRLKFNNFLSKELHLRGLGRNLRLDLEQRRNKLVERVKMEEKINDLKLKVKRCEKNPKALYLLVQAIPCILHMEMRVGLKILTMFINAGLGEAASSSLPWQQGPQEKNITQNKMKDQYAEQIEKVINECILGTPQAPGQFKIKFETDKSTGNQHVVVPISLANNAVRAIVRDMALIVEKSITGEDVKKIKNGIEEYHKAMEILRIKHRDVTELEIKKFQKHIDNFFNAWVEMFGWNGLTNYIHYLAAGHVAFYMKEYGNLSKYSNQGWEALNSGVKCFYFRGTNRGGGGGKGKRVKSKLVAIGEWLQRRYCWILLDTDSIFHENGLKTDMYKEYTPVHELIDGEVDDDNISDSSDDDFDNDEYEIQDI